MGPMGGEREEKKKTLKKEKCYFTLSESGRAFFLPVRFLFLTSINALNQLTGKSPTL
jgi:hypothetical protein